jgi:hypothetical protein
MCLAAYHDRARPRRTPGSPMVLPFMHSRYSILAFLVMVVAVPFAAAEYYLSIVNPIFLTIVGAIGPTSELSSNNDSMRGL